MNRAQFEVFREALLKEEDQITKTKGKDYTKSSVDVLANFKEGAVFGLTPLQTAGMFAKKHIDSIYNYIKTNGQSESEPIRERIKDARNYLMFILALIEDQRGDEIQQMADDRFDFVQFPGESADQYRERVLSNSRPVDIPKL